MKNNHKQKTFLFFLFLFFISLEVSGCKKQKVDFLLEAGQDEEQTETEASLNAAEEERITPKLTEPPEDIFVDVCGAVQKPGVYRMHPESRVFQAIEAAGGFLPEAAGNSINQAQPLADGQQVYVPTEEEAEKSSLAPAAESPQNQASGNTTEKVNLNSADAAELQTLTGIGESKAQAILAYREEHGGFSAVEELMHVPGIKENTFLKIKDKIAVE